MSDLGDLYQEVILDHSRHPHNYHALPGADRKAEGFNPLSAETGEVVPGSEAG